MTISTGWGPLEPKRTLADSSNTASGWDAAERLLAVHLLPAKPKRIRKPRAKKPAIIVTSVQQGGWAGAERLLKDEPIVKLPTNDVELPAAILDRAQTSAAKRLLKVLYQYSDSKTGAVSLNAGEAAEAAGMGAENVRGGARELERAGLLVTSRSRRNLGRYFDVNVYLLTLPLKRAIKAPSPNSEALVGSRAEQVDIKSTTANTQGLVPGVIEELLRNSSLLVGRGRPTGEVESKFESETKRRRKPAARSWKMPVADYLAARMYRSELRRTALEYPQRKRFGSAASRRFERPMADWTVYEVTAHFCDWMKKIDPYSPAYIRAPRLSGALRHYRSKYETEALIELNLMDQFFNDRPLTRAAVREPQKSVGMYLNLFKGESLERARRGVRGEVMEAVRDAAIAELPPLVASDGKVFLDTRDNRELLAWYETRLEQGAKHLAQRAAARAAADERAAERQAAEQAKAKAKAWWEARWAAEALQAEQAAARAAERERRELAAAADRELLLQDLAADEGPAADKLPVYDWDAAAELLKTLA